MFRLCSRLVLAGALVLPVAAPAADWNFMLKADKKEALAFFDMSSVVKLGGKVGLRSMLMRREDKIDPNAINAITFEEAFDCKARTVQLLGETLFGMNMRELKFNKINKPPAPVVPSTFEKHKLDIVCAKDFGPGKRSVLYMEVDSNLVKFRDHFVEQELATARALEKANQEAAGIPPPPPEPPSIFNRK